MNLVIISTWSLALVFLFLHSSTASSAPLSNLNQLNKIALKSGIVERKKRSVAVAPSPSLRLNKTRVTWRLMINHTNPELPTADQTSVIAEAIKYWSEVTPICFKEDNVSSQVDIKFGFFQGASSEVSQSVGKEIHFNLAVPFSLSTAPSSSVSLLLVAVHEIGIVLGLNRSTVHNSVMNSNYLQNIRGPFELRSHDRQQVTKLYGECTGKFDIIMDYVRNRGPTRVYNTYIFSGNKHWLYENANRRPSYGYPKDLSTKWVGLPADLDTYVHYTAFNGRLKLFTDRYYFFKGATYYRFDRKLQQVTQSGRIQELFKSSNLGTIPNNLDAAFFEFHTRLIFFFHIDKVYKYAYKLSGAHSCCAERPRLIEEVFPPATPADRFPPGNNQITYTSNLDAVYFSFKTYTLYLIRDEHAWAVDGYRITGGYNERNHRVRYLGKWNSLWKFICGLKC